MLLEIEINKNVYKNFVYKINNDYNPNFDNSNYSRNGLIIKYFDNYYFTTCFDNLDFLMNINSYVDINICNIVLQKKIGLSVVSFGDLVSENFEDDEMFDGYFDIHTNLLFIKVDEGAIEFLGNDYSEITNYSVNDILKVNYKNKKIKYECFNNNVYIHEDIINEEYVWKENYMCLPPVPFLRTSSSKTSTGCKIYDDDNKICGLVSGVYEDRVEIIPVLLIIRSLEYLNKKKLQILKIDTKITYLDLHDTFGNIIPRQHGVTVLTSYYDDYLKILRKEKK